MRPLRNAAFIIALPLALVPGSVFASGSRDGPGARTAFPVPREQAVVVETDAPFSMLNKANPLFTSGDGVQWGSGWHNVANEWDWYDNYATGERILWRTTGWEKQWTHTIRSPYMDVVSTGIGGFNRRRAPTSDLVGRALDRWYYDLPAVPALEKTFAAAMSDECWTNWPVPGRMHQVPFS